MKDFMTEKTRVIDLHLKENQNKLHNIEKNVDLLERSYDVLKDDYERSAPSCPRPRQLI
jgi:hypothetical protein